MVPDEIEVEEGSAVIGPCPCSHGTVVFFAGLGNHNATPYRRGGDAPSGAAVSSENGRDGARGGDNHGRLYHRSFASGPHPSNRGTVAAASRTTAVAFLLDRALRVNFHRRHPPTPQTSISFQLVLVSEDHQELEGARRAQPTTDRALRPRPGPQQSVGQRAPGEVLTGFDRAARVQQEPLPGLGWQYHWNNLVFGDECQSNLVQAVLCDMLDHLQ